MYVDCNEHAQYVSFKVTKDFKTDQQIILWVYMKHPWALVRHFMVNIMHRRYNYTYNYSTILQLVTLTSCAPHRIQAAKCHQQQCKLPLLARHSTLGMHSRPRPHQPLLVCTTIISNLHLNWRTSWLRRHPDTQGGRLLTVVSNQ